MPRLSSLIGRLRDARRRRPRRPGWRRVLAWQAASRLAVLALYAVMWATGTVPAMVERNLAEMDVNLRIIAVALAQHSDRRRLEIGPGTRRVALREADPACDGGPGVRPGPAGWHVPPGAVC